MKWFTGDWLRAPDVRGLTPAARGIWFDLLNIMHEADRRGYLLVSGKIPTHSQLARMTGCDSEEFSRLLTEIVSSGVSSITEEGIVFCRRMVAEESKRIKCTEAGKRGGNPALKGNGYPNAQPPPKGTVCTSESLDSSDSLILEVFKHYRNYHPRALRNPQPASKEYRHAKARLSEGYTVADLSKAIDGCHKTPHNLGDNERGEKYLDLELILRDSAHVERFMRNADDPPRPRGPISREQARQDSNFGAINEFLDSHGIRSSDGKPLRIEENG